MTRSKYDELHDRYLAILSSKAGTRYERLAALVFKCLHEQHAVVHDFKLTGNSTVKHQIDVLVEEDGKRKRVLVECKDFDKSGKPVGLGVLRDFRSVLEDTGADEAFVVTCTGFTKQAQKYAKAKGIKLAVLRAFEEADWEGRVRRVVVNLIIQPPPQVEAFDLALDHMEQTTFLADMEAEGIGLRDPQTGAAIFRSDSPLFFVSKNEKIQLDTFVTREAQKEASRTQQKHVDISVNPEKWKIQIGERNLIHLTKLNIRATIFETVTHSFQVAPDRIAELILKGFGDRDIIVFADQLKTMTIETDGGVAYR
jgi:hypothetical protein